MYIIYEKSTTRLYGGSLMPNRYSTERGAKICMTRKGKNPELWAVADEGDFHSKIEKQVTKKNLISGKEFTQPVNTPLCCDPSSETYWNM